MMFAPMIQALRREPPFGNWRDLLPRPQPGPSPILAEQEHFRLKLAETPEEIRAAQALRYRVFKEEQGRLAQCRGGLDRDRFDRFCRHLLVIDKASNRVVGTYRELSGPAALMAGRFYSEDEFEVVGLRRLRREVCEVGRSCVDPEFRSGAVVALLWSGLAELRNRPRRLLPWLPAYARRRRETPAFHYLFGCVSLEEGDSATAWALYDYFRQHDLLSAELLARPRPGFELPEAERYCAGQEKELLRKLPPLFKGYLKLGAKVCGPPAFDREFGSIDFLILLDMRQMTERYARHFLPSFHEKRK